MKRAVILFLCLTLIFNLASCTGVGMEAGEALPDEMITSNPEASEKDQSAPEKEEPAPQKEEKEPEKEKEPAKKEESAKSEKQESPSAKPEEPKAEKEEEEEKTPSDVPETPERVPVQEDTTPTPTPTPAPSNPKPSVNEMRPDYDYGTLRSLKGDLVVAVFYMNDWESQWSKAEMEAYTEKEIKPALDFLKKEAASRGIPLNFEVKTYSPLLYTGKVILDVRAGNGESIDVLDQAARSLNYTKAEQLYYNLQTAHGGKEIICLTVFNKAGTGYAINPPRGSVEYITEHCILFSKELSPFMVVDGGQSSVVAAMILYLYGAESLSSSASRKEIAQTVYPTDLMLIQSYFIRENSIGNATAFYIGWIDEPPAVLSYKDW